MQPYWQLAYRLVGSRGREKIASWTKRRRQGGLLVDVHRIEHVAFPYIPNFKSAVKGRSQEEVTTRVERDACHRACMGTKREVVTPCYTLLTTIVPTMRNAASRSDATNNRPPIRANNNQQT